MPGTPDDRRDLTLLAFDFGHRRIGVAVGQQITASASPLGTAANGEAGPDWRRIGGWIAEWEPDLLVVGLPYHVDGSRSAMTDDVEAFVDALGRFGRPVMTVDERYSSLEGKERLREARAAGRRGRIRKETVDTAAAVLIAERWLDERRQRDGGK